MKARHPELLARLAMFATLGAILSACHSAPTRFFTLDSDTPSSAPAAYQGNAVRIDIVHFPPALDRTEVVTEVRPGELRVSDFDHWSAPPGQLARQALSVDLVRRLPPGRVIFPNLAKPAGALGISVDILDFTADAQGASLQASWIVSSSGSEPKSGGTVMLRLETPATGAAAAAQVLSTLLGQLADRIVAGLPASP